jgi:hypothetical protein
MRTGMAVAIRPDRRYPRFRRVPSMRDAAQDPGRATVPRIPAPHVLPSTDENVSAPAILSLSWLTPAPHMIAVYASPWSSPLTPQHSLPGGRYSLPGPDFHRLELASLTWRTSSRLSRDSIRLDPAEDGRVVHLNAAVQQHQLEIAVADREHQIPSHGPQDHLGGELPPLEPPALTHCGSAPLSCPRPIIPESKPASNFATEPWALSGRLEPR